MGRNNRWIDQREKKKSKAEKRDERLARRKAQAQAQSDGERPVGWVSPYAPPQDGNRDPVEMDEMEALYAFFGVYGTSYRTTKPHEIKEVAEDVFGGSYYCVGEQPGGPQLRARSDASPSLL